MAAPKGLKVSDIEEALRQHRGNMTAAGEALGVTRQNISIRVAGSSTLTALVDELTEVRVDRAEMKLDEAVDRGELPAVFYLLSRLGKHRGYVEKTQSEHSGDVKIEWVRVHNNAEN